MRWRVALLVALSLISSNCGDVGPEGGVITHPGGVSVSVSPNTFFSRVTISVAPIAVDASEIGFLPVDFSVVGGVEVSFPGTAAKPLALSLTPSAVPEAGHIFFLVKLISIDASKRLSIVDTAAYLQGGLRASAGPPLPGVLEPGTYLFISAPELALANFRIHDAGIPLAGAIVEPSGVGSAFLGVADLNGLAALALPIGEAPASIFALGRSANGRLSADVAPLAPELVIPIPPPPVLEEFPTVPDALTDLFLKQLDVDVDDLPEGDAGCKQTPIILCPSALPEDLRPMPGACPSPRFDPFEPGDQQQLDVICIGEGPCESDRLEDVLLSPLKGFDLATILFRASGVVDATANPLRKPAAITPGGLATAIEPGTGDIVAVATKRCLRKRTAGSFTVPIVLYDQTEFKAPLRVTCPPGTQFSEVTRRCDPPDPDAIFVITSTFNQGSSPTRTFNQASFAAGTPGSGARLQSSIGKGSLEATLTVSSDNCSRFNSFSAGSRFQVYVRGVPETTAFRIAYAASAILKATATGRSELIASVSSAAGLRSIVSDAIFVPPGQADTRIGFGSDIEVGFTSRPTLTLNGVPYSFAQEFRFEGSAGPNGSCFDCRDNGCCECGLVQGVQTFTLELLR